MEPGEHYAREWHYDAAILSRDRAQLPMLIIAAQAAIEERLAEIRARNDGTSEEQQPIEEALNGLRILIKELRE